MYKFIELKRYVTIPVLLIFFLLILIFIFSGYTHRNNDKENTSISIAFKQASLEFHVPEDLLKAICFMEGDMSNHNGYPSEDNGYGCMHLIKNDRADTLDEAASLLHVSTNQLKVDMKANIRGGAAVLQGEELNLARKRFFPTSLADWYGAVADYSHANTQASAEMYADAIYSIFDKGLSAPADTGEIITLAPNPVTPNKTTADHLTFKNSFPHGCVDDGKTDYPGAIDCMLDPNKYSCTFLSNNDTCTYEEANRPVDFPITFVAIHYFEAYLKPAVTYFYDSKNLVSIHYIIDSDGTVYQITPEKDIAYHLGNYWYNQRSIGIEHTGFGPSGFTWFNAAQYLGSAKLTAYLADKYSIPLDHDHIVSHGTVPAATLDSSPNHVDPGQYWQWDYYFNVIHQQGISYPKRKYTNNVISIHPQNGLTLFSPNGSDVSDNLNFFYLYSGPGTRYSLIPSTAFVTDRIDETDNIESDLSYVYLNKIIDPAGSGENLYQIWYGVNDNISQRDPLFISEGVLDSKNVLTPSNWFTNAKLVWLAVPANDIQDGDGTIVRITASGLSNQDNIYGMPVSDKKYIIGNAQEGAIFVSAFTEIEQNNNLTWYEINYNHRQAWIPSNEISLL